jgi:hypothetical protein
MHSFLNRRHVLIGSAPLFLPRPARAAPSKPPAPTSTLPLADVPMRTLKLPKGGVGRDYVLVQLKIAGQGPFDFMVDSGLTGELLTPHLQQLLGLGQGSGGKRVSGLGAGGAVSAGELVELRGASLCCGDFPGLAPGAKELPLPPLTAVRSGPPGPCAPAPATPPLPRRECGQRPRLSCCTRRACRW